MTAKRKQGKRLVEVAFDEGGAARKLADRSDVAEPADEYPSGMRLVQIKFEASVDYLAEVSAAEPAQPALSERLRSATVALAIILVRLLVALIAAAYLYLSADIASGAFRPSLETDSLGPVPGRASALLGNGP